MRFEKKTIAIILVATIGLSLFVGLASAPGRVDPISQIIEMLLGIDAKLDSIEEKIDNSQATTILDFYDGIVWGYTSSYGDSLPGTYIETDKPVLFTVSMVVWQFDEPERVDLIAGGETVGSRISVREFYPADGDKQIEVITFAGCQMEIWGMSVSGPGFNVAWHIMIQGTSGTIVTVQNP